MEKRSREQRTHGSGQISRRRRDGAAAALIVAHPGHELRLHGWIERVRPLVFVLTDGSGRAGESRLASTTRLLRRAGGRPGDIYGRFTDVDLYDAVLNGEHDVFLALAEELAAALIREGIRCVVADAAEDAIMAHDVCRALVNAAVALVRRRAGVDLDSFDFPIIASPQHCPHLLQADARWLSLDDTALARKLAAAHDYTEIRAEVDATLARFGVEAFRAECLRPVTDDRPGNDSGHDRPLYELHGERLVAEGHYPRTIRYQEHVAPLVDALRRHDASPRAAAHSPTDLAAPCES